ncbi:glycerophosphoryl diester phosphodiesterase membrane domain-containing protein [Levilactobacillus brevis]|uniref:glycerophosphoryl diester phosphodiesterase membrane domain-containing protein n=1 Tax=Levilactobacillus brevis TaxID=1580 RepID=UPI001118A680|nr:glycerophosphodiester phosphodiesterase [Levilactobacillus brevis]QCZ46841.1 hypothetical protein UCCLB556_1966 [Levilactobacillus brevis]
MATYQFLLKSTKRFYQHWGSYITLIFGTNILISYLVVPVFNWLLGNLLKSQGITHVSYTNFPSLFYQHPLAIVGMLILLLAIITLAYWQFAFLLLEVINILKGKPKTLITILIDTGRSLRGASISTFLLFIGYFLIILPFGSYIFTTPLLNKAQIPAFIVSYLMTYPWMAVGLVLFYLVTGYLGIRLMSLLPIMIIDQLPWRTAIKESWQRTRFNFWYYLLCTFLILVTVTIITTIFYTCLYFIQVLFDHIGLGFTAAAINLLIMETITGIIVSYTSVLFMMLVITCYNQGNLFTESIHFHLESTVRLQRWARTGLVFVIILFGAGAIFFNLSYLNGSEMSTPLLISHRGVDNGYGVQNTIPSLIKTSKESPDYIEMDIQVTKDHKFVVMHDNDLNDLANRDVAPYELNLKQLQKITVSENGYKAKIPSFSEYLDTAIKHHQKLLIEIKPTSYYTRQDTKHFIQEYGQKILANHEQIHTLSYQIMSDLKKEKPALFVNYILPYNLTYPYTKANGYTMESTTLDEAFIKKSSEQNKKVYAWDIDDTGEMDRMMFLGVDAIITDNLRQMRAEIRLNTIRPSYARLLLTYMNKLQVDNDFD